MLTLEQRQALQAQQGEIWDQLEELSSRVDDWTDEDETRFDELTRQHREAREELEADDEQRSTQQRRRDAVQTVQRAAPRPPATPAARNLPAVHVAARSHPAERLGHLRGSLQAFRGERALENAYEASLWMRSELLGQQHAREELENLRAMTGTTNAAGGFTVPDIVSSTIIETINEVGVTPQIAHVEPMASDVQTVPTITAGQTVYYPAQAAAITPSDLTMANVTLTISERAVLTEIANQLIADSSIMIADRVAMRAAYELADRMDNELINGDGTTAYGSVTGLVSAIGEAGSLELGAGDTTWSTVVLADFNNVMGVLPSKYWRDADLCWIMRRDFFASTAARLAWAAGGNTADTIAGGMRPQFFGYPVYFTSHMPADGAGNTAAFFGNFRESVILGQRQAIELASSEHYAFNKNATAIRATARYDIQAHAAGDGSNAGGFVSMELAAA